MARLGGQTVDLNPQVTQLGRGEPLEDTRVLSRFCDVLAIRTFAQQELADYAHWATIPVINAHRPGATVSSGRFPHHAGSLRRCVVRRSPTWATATTSPIR